MTSGCHGDHILYTIGWRSRSSAFSRKSLRFQWQHRQHRQHVSVSICPLPAQQSHPHHRRWPMVAQVASPQLWNPPKDWWKTCQKTHGAFTTVEIVGVPLHCSIIQLYPVHPIPGTLDPSLVLQAGARFSARHQDTFPNAQSSVTDTLSPQVWVCPLSGYPKIRWFFSTVSSKICFERHRLPSGKLT